MFLKESNHIVHIGEEVTESTSSKLQNIILRAIIITLNFLLKPDLSAPKSIVFTIYYFQKRKRGEEIEKKQQKIALRTGW